MKLEPTRSRLDNKGTVVDVTHPGGVNTAYALVAALQELGYQGRFHTCFYYKPELWRWLLGSVPAGTRRRLERELGRRFTSDIDSRRVTTWAWPELAYVSAARAGLPFRVPQHLIGLRNSMFDRRIAGYVELARPDVIIAHDGAARRTFESARKSGVIGVLHQVIGHITTSERILGRERALHPDFARSLRVGGRRSAKVDHTAEALAADFVLAPSEFVKDTLVDIGVEPTRVVVLPYGVDVDRFRPADNRLGGPFRVLFVGQISQRKGISYLLEAFRRLSMKDAELVLAGSVIDRAEALRRYSGLFRHVSNVPYSEIHREFQNADVFVFPSLHEGSAMVTYEALACGLPVITTPNSGSVVRDGKDGYIVPIRDVDAIMDRIHRLYEDRKLLAEMSKNARARANEYSWANYRHRLGQALGTIIGARAG